MIRILAFTLLAGLVLVACGPSAAQVKTARTATYNTTASVTFQAAVSALKANDYKLAAADPVTGQAESVTRWYEEDGTFVAKNSDDEVVQKDKMIALTMHVAVVPAGGGFRVEVTPHATQLRSGYSALVPLTEHDAPMTSWIAGKVDNLYVTIYDTLKKDAAAPAAAP